jgi:hypothetical protein
MRVGAVDFALAAEQRRRLREALAATNAGWALA